MPNEAALPQALVSQPLPLDITKYSGPGTEGKQWLKIIKMYAIEYNWTPARFLEVAQVRATGDLYHKLEGMIVTNETATIDQIFKRIMELITPQANLYDTMWGIQSEGRKPGESMEGLASRIKVAMTNYETSTGCKFLPIYQVDVFINAIRDKELSMKLREGKPANLDDAVKVAAAYMTNKKNVEKVCGRPPSNPFNTYREPQHHEEEPMEVDQVRFQRRRNDPRRPFQQQRSRSVSQNRNRTRSSEIVCFVCNRAGHTGHQCVELQRCKEIIAKYQRQVDDFSGKNNNTRRDKTERKFRKLNRLVRELDIQEETECDNSSDYTDVEEEPQQQQNVNDEKPFEQEEAAKDF